MRGQTAAEYMGMLLVVAMIIVTLAQLGLTARIRDGIVEQSCQVLNDEGDCPAAQRRAQERKRALQRTLARQRDSDDDHVPDALERRRGTSAFMRDTDGDRRDDAAEIRASTAGVTIRSWDVCRRMLNKTLCDALKAVDRATTETARVAVGALCVDSDLCWKAAIGLKIVSGDARESTAAMLGQTIGSMLTPAAIVDFVKQVIAGKPIGIAIAAVGVIPLARAPKAAERISRFLARNPKAATEVAKKVGDALGKHSEVLRVVLSLAIPGYRKLRAGELSHDGVVQLMRAGNDIHYLARSSRMLKRGLSAAERATINDAIKKHWPGVKGNQRTGAYGHEAALVLLARKPEIEILYKGRPGDGPAGGPDIIARNTSTGRPIIIEAKATFQDDNPLDLAKLTKKLKSGTYVQPERPWVAASADRGYIRKLARSNDPLERQAAAYMRDIVGKRAIYDVSIIQTRNPGARAYGDGVDTAVKKFREDDRIGDIAIVDVDAGKRGP